jgi:hypothetical protein
MECFLQCILLPSFVRRAWQEDKCSAVRTLDKNERKKILKPKHGTSKINNLSNGKEKDP